jgi:immunoglobulin-binding protein 1
MDESGVSLRELFSSAKAKQEELDSGAAGHQEMLQSTISAFEECRNLISKLAIFSPNEEIEDISTPNLQYDISALGLSLFQLTRSQIFDSRVLAGRAVA